MAKGEMAHGLSDAFASVTCWGADVNSFNLEIEKAKGFLGLNYGTIRFVINPKKIKMISFERI